MNLVALQHETDIEKVRATAVELLQRNQILEAESTVLIAEIVSLTKKLALAVSKPEQVALNLQLKKLNEQLALKNAELFGPSRSERRGRPNGKEAATEKPKQTGHGPTPQPDLPLETETHELDEADQICPECGDPLPVMEGQTEDSEQITIKERRVVRVLHQRKKYRCKCCGHIDTALPGPAPLVPSGRYSPEFAVESAIEKYSDHLPLERQVKRLERDGLIITSATLWDQLVVLYYLLLPTYLALRAQMLTQPVLGADESSWRLMGKGGSKKWWIWALVAPDAVFYQLAPTRGALAALALLEGYEGILMVDGYAAYRCVEKLGKDPQLPLFEAIFDLKAPRITVVTCWMHARRTLIEAEKNHPSASAALDLIAQLYAIEDQAEVEAAGDPQKLLEIRRQLRATASREVIEKLEVWRAAQRPVPTLRLDKAVTYLRNQWPWLIRFLEDPKIPLDNGASERAMRGPVLGRKNHYGSRSELGTRVASLFYSLVETCKLLEVNPRAWMIAAVKQAMTTPGSVLLPATWKAEQEG